MSLSVLALYSRMEPNQSPHVAVRVDDQLHERLVVRPAGVVGVLVPRVVRPQHADALGLQLCRDVGDARQPADRPSVNDLLANLALLGTHQVNQLIPSKERFRSRLRKARLQVRRYRWPVRR